jgi:hypothetical protein
MLPQNQLCPTTEASGNANSVQSCLDQRGKKRQVDEGEEAVFRSSPLTRLSV